MRSHRSLFVAPLPLLLLVACGGTNPANVFSQGDGGSTPIVPGKDGGSGPVIIGDAGGIVVSHGDGGTKPGGDGGTAVCAPNPLNYDIPGNNCDDDDDGVVDNPPACDTGLTLTGTASQFAQAMDICTGTHPAVADSTHWGVVSAVYTRSFSDNTKAPANGQWGIMSQYGSVVTPRVGQSLGVLSSGWARDYDDQTATSCDPSGAETGCFKGGVDMDDNFSTLSMNNPCDAPSGFPKNSTGCPNTASEPVNDLIDLKLTIKVPANAQGLSFDFNFFSGEWPDYVCTDYNDSFIAYLHSTAFNKGTPDNISFDSNNNPINVNSGFFAECTPNTPLGCDGTPPASLPNSVCSAGPAGLAGTGFAPTGVFCTNTSTSGGATGWLTSQAPVTPGETITIEFMIWDTNDAMYDSSVVLDALSWIPTPTETVTLPTPPSVPQ